MAKMPHCNPIQNAPVPRARSSPPPTPARRSYATLPEDMLITGRGLLAEHYRALSPA